MAEKDSKHLIQNTDQAQSKAIGTFNVTLTGAPFPLPAQKRIEFTKIQMEGTPVLWQGQRVGYEQLPSTSEFIGFSFQDSLPDGRYPLSIATVSLDYARDSFKEVWAGTAGEFMFTSDRTPGNEHLYGTFTNCKMVLETNASRHFYMSGSFDLKQIEIIP